MAENDTHLWDLLRERVDALTMNLELQSRETEALRASIAELRGTVGDMSPKVAVPLQGTTNLPAPAQTHER